MQLSAKFDVAFPSNTMNVPCGGGFKRLHHRTRIRRRRQKVIPVPGNVIGPSCHCGEHIHRVSAMRMVGLDTALITCSVTSDVGDLKEDKAECSVIKISRGKLRFSAGCCTVDYED